MEGRALEIRLDENSRINWIFRGAAERRLELLAAFASVVEARPGLPSAVTVDVSVSPRLSREQLNWSPEQTIVCNDGMAARVSSERRVEILLFKLDFCDMPNGRLFEIDQLIRILWFGFLPQLLERKLLVAHGALLVRDDRGVIVTGPGGSGKSTCARRVPPPWRAVADDAVLIHRSAQGKYHAHALPTWSRYAGKENTLPPADMQNPVELAGIYRIIKSPEDRIAPLGEREKSMMGMRQFCDLRQLWKIGPRNIFYHPMMSAVAEFSAIAARELPMGELHCSLHGRFWDALSGFEV